MRRFVSLVVAALMVTACTPGANSSTDDRVDMKEADLVGTWQRDEPGGALTFEPDGDFLATGLPYELFRNFTGVLPPGFDPERDSLDGTGSWTLKAPRTDRSGPRNHVYLDVATLSGRPVATGADLRVERQGSAIVLTFYIGDPDLNNRIVYNKCKGDCASPGLGRS
jgi:hypothetical protein